MQWQDKAIIISVKPFGENANLISLFTKEYGLQTAIIKNLHTKQNKNICQTGNIVNAKYFSKSPDSLGSVYLEMDKPIIPLIMQSYVKLLIVRTLMESLGNILLVNERQDMLYSKTEEFLLALPKYDQINYLTKYALLELNLLESAGFGLDLSACVVTGRREDLAYISPKSGSVVSKEAGEEYHDKLFKLPDFFMNKDKVSDLETIREALKITNYFFNKHIVSNNKNSKIEARKLLYARIFEEIVV